DTLYPPPVFTFRLFRLGDNYSDTGGLAASGATSHDFTMLSSHHEVSNCLYRKKLITYMPKTTEAAKSHSPAPVVSNKRWFKA
ncbi:hypothetical protein, partial [Aeromonas caviae]